MGVPPTTEVVELRRRITADGEVVAYSFDLMPLSIFPDDFDPAVLTGSVFAYFQDVLGLEPWLGIAEVHAVESAHVAWGPDAHRHRLFVLLDQLQYDRGHTAARLLAHLLRRGRLRLPAGPHQRVARPDRAVGPDGRRGKRSCRG